MSAGDRTVVAALAVLAVATAVALLWLTLVAATQWILSVVLLASFLVATVGAHRFVLVPGTRRHGRGAGNGKRRVETRDTVSLG